MNFKTTFTYSDTEYYKNWISFYPKRDYITPFRLQLESWGYFDPRPQFNFNITSALAIVLPFFSIYLLPISILFLFFGWGQIYLKLPFDSGKANECENPQYGINTYKSGNKVDEVWLYWGNKRKHIGLPWSYNWYRTSLLLKNGEWEHELKGQRKEFYKDEWKEKQWSEDYIYTYTLRSGEIQKIPTTITVKEWEWRPKIFRWCSLFNSVNKSITIDFSEEVGEERGSWKGGVTGCSYDIKGNESPLDCLKRMEKERRFER